MTEICADMKAKGSGFLKNMKDEDEEQDGFWGRQGREMREIWSDMKAQGNMNIMLCGSVMCEGEKERK